MAPNQKLDLIAELSGIARVLGQRRLPPGGVLVAVAELIETARALGVPTDSRRDDAPVFLDGTEKIETATWTQCGGILFALRHDAVPEPQAIAVRVAQRLFELAPTHR